MPIMASFRVWIQRFRPCAQSKWPQLPLQGWVEDSGEEKAPGYVYARVRVCGRCRCTYSSSANGCPLAHALRAGKGTEAKGIPRCMAWGEGKKSGITSRAPGMWPISTRESSSGHALKRTRAQMNGRADNECGGGVSGLVCDVSALVGACAETAADCAGVVPSAPFTTTTRSCACSQLCVWVHLRTCVCTRAVWTGKYHLGCFRETKNAGAYLFRKAGQRAVLDLERDDNGHMILKPGNLFLLRARAPAASKRSAEPTA
eukprot:5908056-Pleurochrysis_carterae.AAC.2